MGCDYNLGIVKIPNAWTATEMVKYLLQKKYCTNYDIYWQINSWTKSLSIVNNIVESSEVPHPAYMSDPSKVIDCSRFCDWDAFFVAVEKILGSSTTSLQTCICTGYDLARTGCSCGGFAAEQARKGRV